MIPYSYVVSTLANNGVGLGIPSPTTLTLRSDGCTDPLRRQVNGTIVGGHTTIQGGCPTNVKNKVTSEGGVFVQDRWNIDRLTVSAGLRLDWFYSENPEFQLAGSLLTPNRNYTVPKFSTTQYKDWTPKVAAAYDLFGDGRTALKVNYGKYVLGQALVVGGLAAQPGYNVQLTSSRGWVDNNRNFIPDCDLANPLAQGPTLSGSQNQIDTCNAPAGVNANFYDNVLRPNLAVQDDARYGWGKRPYSWEFAVAAQHELNQGLSVTAGVFWRWFGNFLVTDNTSGTVADYAQFSVTPGLIPAPPASAGGESLPDDNNTGGYFAINPGVLVNNVTGLSKTMFPDSNVYDRWFGYDLTANMRLAGGLTLQGGLSTGHQTTDFCDVQDPAKAGNNALVEMLTNANGLASLDNVSHGAELAAAGEVPRLLHHPEDRRAARRLVPEHPGRRVRGVIRRGEQRRVAAGVAGRPRPSAGGRSGDGHDDRQPGPAGLVLRPALQPDRRASGQGDPVRQPAGRGQPGPVQHPQLGHDQQRERGLRDVARACECGSAPSDEGVVDLRLLDRRPSRRNTAPRFFGDGSAFPLVSALRSLSAILPLSHGKARQDLVGFRGDFVKEH